MTGFTGRSCRYTKMPMPQPDSAKPARAITDDLPDSPRSVGWTQAQTVQLATAEQPFPLECGKSVGPVVVEYETYGKLAPARDNVILVVHALSGDAHVAGWDRDVKATGRLYRTKHPGWWDTVIGPGKAMDTDKYLVICSNFLGSCYGTTGPASTDAATGKPYGMRFPTVTVGDWVQLQAPCSMPWASRASAPLSAARSVASRPWSGRWHSPIASIAPSCWPPRPTSPRRELPSTPSAGAPSPPTPPSTMAITTTRINPPKAAWPSPA